MDGDFIHDSESENLQPCPFCGANSKFGIVVDKAYGAKSAYIGCIHCDCRGPKILGENCLAKSIRAWNKRIILAARESFLVDIEWKKTGLFR